MNLKEKGPEGPSTHVPDSSLRFFLNLISSSSFGRSQSLNVLRKALRRLARNRVKRLCERVRDIRLTSMFAQCSIGLTVLCDPKEKVNSET